MFTTRWNPFEELTSLHRDLDRAFGRQWGEPQTQGVARAWTPPSEVASVDDGWQLRVALPGVDPNQVRISLHGNTLTIGGERVADTEGQVEASRSELVYGPFERTFTLPANVDGEKIRASYRHGMLYLTVPIAASEKPRQIKIEGADLKDIDVKKLA